MNACKLANSIVSLNLTPNELYVYAYLCSIHSKTATLLGDLIKVKQSTIAEKCCLKTTETVSRIISELMRKGLVQRVIRGIKADGRRGTNSYIINKTAVTGGYFYLERRVFGQVSARQFRVYLFIAKSYSTQLNDSWNSYNDIAGQLRISRSEAVEIIAQLVALSLITKERRKSKTNRRVFVDNHYRLVFTVTHRRIARKISKTKRLSLSKKNSLSNVISSPKKMLQVHNSKFVTLCQALFWIFFDIFSRGIPMRWGSPANQGSFIEPKISHQKRKDFKFFKIYYILRDAGFF